MNAKTSFVFFEIAKKKLRDRAVERINAMNGIETNNQTINDELEDAGARQMEQAVNAAINMIQELVANDRVEEAINLTLYINTILEQLGINEMRLNNLNGGPSV